MIEIKSATPAMADEISDLLECVFLRRSVLLWATDLMRGRRPGSSMTDFIVAVDDLSDRIVGAVCLIAQTWRQGPRVLPVAQLELVATHPAFRMQGIFRKLLSRFEAVSAARGAALMAVHGVDELYIRHGFVPSIDFRGGIKLTTAQLGRLASLDSGIVVRSATLADIEPMASLFDAQSTCWDVRTVRSTAMWSYQEALHADSHHAVATRVVEQSGRVCGYFRTPYRQPDDRMIVSEFFVADADVAAGAIGAIQKSVEGTHWNDVELRVPIGHPARQRLMEAGGTVVDPRKWLVKSTERSLSAVGPLDLPLSRLPSYVYEDY